MNRKRILHVAQSQYHDVGAARRAGLATAWIYRRHGQPGYGGTQPPSELTTPDFLATSLEDLVRQYRAELFVDAITRPMTAFPQAEGSRCARTPCCSPSRSRIWY